MADFIIHDFTTIREGTSFKGQQFTVEVNEVAEDLTGAKIEFIYGSDNVFLTTVDNSVVINDGPAGIFSIPEQVLSLRQGSYNYDCKFTFPTGRVKIWMIGNIPISR